MTTLKDTAVVSSQLEAKMWIKEQSAMLKDILEWKLHNHGLRYKRIKKEVQDVRSAEIKIHKERLKSHTTVSIYPLNHGIIIGSMK